MNSVRIYKTDLIIARLAVVPITRGFNTLSSKGSNFATKEAYSNLVERATKIELSLEKNHFLPLKLCAKKTLCGYVRNACGFYYRNRISRRYRIYLCKRRQEMTSWTKSLIGFFDEKRAGISSNSNSNESPRFGKISSKRHSTTSFMRNFTIFCNENPIKLPLSLEEIRQKHKYPKNIFFRRNI